MAHIGKRIKKAREGVARTKLYPLDDAVKLVKSLAAAKFDETVELSINLGVDPKHADQMVRGVVNLPNGTGPHPAGRGVRARRQGGRGARGRGRRRRRRGSRAVRAGRHDRLRPLHRHARHDAARRPSRQGAGPSRADAEPEGRHGDDGRRGRGEGVEGRGGRVPRREGRHRAGLGRQGLVRRGAARRQHPRLRRRREQGQADGRQGHLYAARRDLLDDGAGRQARPRRRCRPPRRSAPDWPPAPPLAAPILYINSRVVRVSRSTRKHAAPVFGAAASTSSVQP